MITEERYGIINNERDGKKMGYIKKKSYNFMR